MNRRQLVLSTAVGTLSLSMKIQPLRATQATPTSENEDPWVIGNAFQFLSTDGEPNTLATVVEPVMFTNSTYAVVLRSFYQSPIALEDVFGTVRDEDGSLLATIDDAYFAPGIIDPNGVCILAVSFHSELSSREQRDGTVELDYEIDSDIVGASVANLSVTDFTIRPDRIIGVVENTTGSEDSLGWIVGVLFEENGELATWFATTTEKWDIPAGNDSTFSENIALPTEMRDIPYLVASRGSSF